MQTSASKEISNRGAASGNRPARAHSAKGISSIHEAMPRAVDGVPPMESEGLLYSLSRGAAKCVSDLAIFPQDSAENFSKQGQDRTSRRLLETPSFGSSVCTTSRGSSLLTIGCNSTRMHFLAAGKTLSTRCYTYTFLSLPMPSSQRSKQLGAAVRTIFPTAFRKISAKNKKN